MVGAGRDVAARRCHTTQRNRVRVIAQAIVVTGGVFVARYCREYDWWIDVCLRPYAAAPTAKIGG